MTRRRSAILAIALSLGLVLSACGDDSSPSVDDDDSGELGDAEGTDFTVTVSADEIEVPDEVTGGVVRIKLESDLPKAQANFAQVAAGTTEEQFKQAISAMVGGGPIPESIRATTGILGLEGGGAEETVILPEGDYIAWSIPDGRDEDAGEPDSTSTSTTVAAAGETARSQENPPSGGSPPPGPPGGPPPESVLTATFKVNPGEAADLPEAGGNEIVARDYTFEVKVTAGARQIVFRNEGPDQLHHVVLMNFGRIAPSVVEEHLPALLDSDQLPPELKDLDPKKVQAGEGPVLTPRLGATTSIKALEAGGTYAALCFITDRTGGPPHATAKGMRTVFTIE